MKGEENQLESYGNQINRPSGGSALESIASVTGKASRALSLQATAATSTPEISQELSRKLEALDIPLDEKVRSAIASHHLSQAYGAIAHIENTRDSINNPRGVFLYQITRQPVGGKEARVQAKTARDFGFTLRELQGMYGDNWRDAAAHFGIEVPQEEAPLGVCTHQ